VISVTDPYGRILGIIIIIIIIIIKTLILLLLFYCHHYSDITVSLFCVLCLVSVSSTPSHFPTGPWALELTPKLNK
jgi:hypothetical protein